MMHPPLTVSIETCILIIISASLCSAADKAFLRLSEGFQHRYCQICESIWFFCLCCICVLTTELNLCMVGRSKQIILVKHED